MPRLALLALPILLVLAAAAPRAHACPAPPPGTDYHCSKYDKMFEQMAMRAFAPVYIRTTRGVLPPRTTGKRAMRHLLASTWTARDPSAQNPRIKILDGANVPDEIDDAVYNAIVHGVTWSGRQYVVSFDRMTYAIQRCRDDHHRLTTCLVRVGG